jgi:uncharacterized protein (DUF2141 family)
MKILAHIVIGLGLVGTANAQTAQAQTAQAPPAQPQPRAARVELMPIPNTLPGILFDPAPLSGNLLMPLAVTGPQAQPAAASPAQAAQPTIAATVVPVEPVAATAEPEVEIEPAVETEAPAVEKPAPEEAEPEVEAKPEPEPAPKKKKEAAPASTTVTVIVEGVESAKGIVNVALCDKSLSKEGCPYTQATKAAAGFVEARFDDVPPGVYAVVGYHDVNANDEFDKMLGVPREPYALSSKAGDMLAPGFKDAALSIKKGENTVIIRMQRLGG